MASTALPKQLRRSNYRLLGLVGQGQFGQVYCAIHRKVGRLVALKNLNRDRLTTHRFLRELRFLLSLEHPNIANCHALEQSATGRQLVLDYCEGGTLRSLMEQEIPLTLAEILTLITEVLAALEQAHSQGIVHCDIKPENILLSLTPEGWQAKVSDFGIARLSQELRGDHTGATGSPAYMAPERFYHQYAEASDLYAVGIILYELLVGDRPFSGSHTQLMVAHLNHVVNIPETLPPDLQTVVHRALEKLMARRFHSAAAMKAAIVAMRQKLTASELRETYPKPIPPPHKGQYQPQVVVPLVGVCQDLRVITADDGTPLTLLAAIGTTVYGWPLMTTDPPVSPHPALKWQFSTPVQRVLDSASGAIAVTENSLYQLRPEQPPHPLAEFTDPIRIMGHHRRWLMVQGGLNPDQYSLVDTLGRVPCHPRGIEIPAGRGDRQSLCLDDRHFLLAEITDHSTHLQLRTRWGKSLGKLRVNSPLRYLVRSATPYQFLACGGTRHQDLLVVQLKPFRVMRCRFEVPMHWLGELIIGFVGVSEAGHLRLANFQGQLIGQIDHLPSPTAIAFQPPFHLWLATQQDNTPALHRIDIRELGLDIVF